jgi:hypothetical protein
VRAALRVLPVVQLERGTSIRDLVLPVYRAKAVLWAAAKYPAHKYELTTACRAAAAARAAQSTVLVWRSNAAAAAIQAADYAVVVIVRDRTAADAARAAALAADAFAAAARANATAFGAAAAAAPDYWSALSDDVRRVEEGAAASVIAGSPLCLKVNRNRSHTCGGK